MHLLLGEKVKVSQTSQSRPAALHTAHCTNISCSSTQLGRTFFQYDAVPLWCCEVVLWEGDALQAHWLSDLFGCAEVKPRWRCRMGFDRTCFNSSHFPPPMLSVASLLNCTTASHHLQLRRLFSGSALCAKDIGNGEALHKHTAPPALPLSGRSYLQAWWCRLQTLPHKYRWHGAEIDKCIQFILILERWKSPCPQCFPGRGIPLQCIFGFDKRYVHWSWSTYLDISC